MVRSKEGSSEIGGPVHSGRHLTIHSHSIHSKCHNSNVQHANQNKNLREVGVGAAVAKKLGVIHLNGRETLAELELCQ